MFGTYKEYKEQMQQQQLASDIRKIIENYQDPTRLLKISDFLALRTAGDVLNLSHCEPYGLKGCKLILIVNDGTEEFNLGTLYPEKGIFSTFEITLVLHLKRSPCRKLPFFRCRQQTMHILEQYELRKEKMYGHVLETNADLCPVKLISNIHMFCNLILKIPKLYQ